MYELHKKTNQDTPERERNMTILNTTAIVRAFTAGLLLASFTFPANAATVNGTAGPDVLWGTARADTVNGFGGNDNLRGREGNDILLGGPGNDTLNGMPGADQVWGGTGNDTVLGGDGDRIYMDAGDDQLSVRAVSFKAWGGAGNDSFQIASGTQGAFLGEDGSDRFELLDGVVNAILSGGPGVDTFRTRCDFSEPMTFTITDFQPATEHLYLCEGPTTLTQFISRFDANNDGQLSRADGLSQVDADGNRYVWTAPASSSPGVRLTVGTANVWLPGVDYLRPEIGG